MRRPIEKDGIAIWELIKGTAVLDLNSPYSYLMLCRYFNKTCVVSELDNRIVGFVSGFLLPESPDVLFIWQVAVHKENLRHGLALAMLKYVIAKHSAKPVRFVKMTVNPTNKAAHKLYRQLAAELKTNIKETEGFPSCLFPGSNHEKEVMLTIGPLEKI